MSGEWLLIPSQKNYKHSLVALVDCNNFYVSCERLFNPKLVGSPVVVLSNNDGCIVSRSQEAKALGIPMGAPLFKWADFLEKHKVVIRSSNYSLYGDLSHRVMQTLLHFNPQCEIYSIDEAFLSLTGVNPLTHCRFLKNKVLQWTGIPVSIGIASTKTLAKLANRSAKKNTLFDGVCFPSSGEIDTLLKTLPVAEIWGIGRRLSLFLAKKGIHSAAELCRQSDVWIKQHLSVTGLRLVWELRGKPCLHFEQNTPIKQSIMTSRSFGKPIFKHNELLEAVCTYAARGGKKLRKEKGKASWIQIFIMTSPHKENHYSNQAHFLFPEPTNYTPTLLKRATECLNVIFRSGFAYKKAGVLLGGIVSENHFQQDLFIPQKRGEEAKKKKIMTLLDQANHTFGYQILQCASEGMAKSWEMKKDCRSACYTTRWPDLLKIDI